MPTRKVFGDIAVASMSEMIGVIVRECEGSPNQRDDIQASFLDARGATSVFFAVARVKYEVNRTCNLCKREGPATRVTLHCSVLDL